MFILQHMRKQRLRFGLLAVLLAMLTGGLMATTRAQSTLPPLCVTINDIRVCGDQSTGDLAGDSFQITGERLTIQYGGASTPSLQVFPMLQFNPQISPNHPLRKPVFERHADSRATGGATYTLKGDIYFFNPAELNNIGGILASSQFLGDNTTTPTTAGFFHVDIENRLITNAPAATPTERNAGLPRNALVQFDMFRTVELFQVFRATPEEHATVSMEINLPSSFVSAQVVMPQRVFFPTIRDVNPTLTVHCIIKLNGEISREPVFDGMQFRAGGAIGRFKGVQVLRAPGERATRDALEPQQNNDKPINFEAEAIEFLRADNPGLPNLDPSKPDLIFSVQGLQYKDGRLSVKGGAVGLPDWEVGKAFKLTNQQISLQTNKAGTDTTVAISSTLTFPAGSVLTEARSFPMAISMGARQLPDGKVTTAFTGTLLSSARPALDFGPLTISTPGRTSLVFDPASNFFGLVADQVTVKWDGNLGGGSGIQSGLRLGIDKDKRLVFGLGAGGAINLPALRSQAMTLQVSGSIVNAADLTTFLITGNAQLALPGNGAIAPGVTMFIRSGKDVRDVCSASVPSCKRRFEFTLSRFEFKLAGFGIGVTNAKGTSDGGFFVEQAKLSAPAGVASIGGSISGLTVSGNGNISLTGGSVELPPLQIGSFSLVGVKGSFLKTTTGYEFKGAGTVPLPGLEPNSGKKITGEVIVRARPDGSFTGFGVSIAFNTGSPGIPIASTGMELTQLSGGFDVNSGTVKITVGMRASSQLRFGPLPAVAADGTASLQFQPFQLTANAKLSVLVIQVAEASVGIGHQQGFSGGPGFNVSFEINFVLARGQTALRIGPVTLSNGQRKTVIAAQASYTVGIKRSAIFPLMPPRDINVAALEFNGGTFTVKGQNETLGLLGRVKIKIPFLPDPSLSIFVNLEDRKVDVTDTDDYKLIDAVALREQAARNVAGYSSRALAPSEASSIFADESLAARSSLLQETLPVVLERPGMALFGISYPPGSSPQLRLELPDGTVLNEQSVAEGKISFLRYTESLTEPHELAFMLAEAQAGSYRLIVDGAPADYSTVSYMLNDEPIVGDVAVRCGGSALEGIAITCAGAAAGSEATIDWTMADRDSPNATVQVGFAPLASDGSADLLQITPLAEGLPAGTGSFTWQLGDVASGSYALVVSASDEQNAPVHVVAATPIIMEDKRAPAAPQQLVAEAQPGELLVQWAPNAERDLAGYEIGFGVVQAGVADDAANFVYLRDMGAKETSVERGDVYDAKLWGLTDNQEVFVGLRAYDQNGNRSDWTLLRAQPWALAPAAWTPIPEGQLLTAGAVEVAFDTPLDLPADEFLPEGLLQVRDAAGNLVAGRLEALTTLEDEQVMGLRFVPAQRFQVGASYSAVLRGGSEGVRSVDGRQMPADYTWSFETYQEDILLPLVAR